MAGNWDGERYIKMDFRFRFVLVSILFLIVDGLFFRYMSSYGIFTHFLLTLIFYLLSSNRRDGVLLMITTILVPVFSVVMASLIFSVEKERSNTVLFVPLFYNAVFLMIPEIFLYWPAKSFGLFLARRRT